MAKFCGKCGTRLDETTGLCPNCDADKLKRESGLRGSEDMLRQMRSENRKLRGKKQVEEKRATQKKKPVNKKGKKPKKKIIKWMLELFVLLLIVFGVAYFKYLDKSVIDVVLEKIGVKQENTVFTTQIIEENYVPNEKNIVYENEGFGYVNNMVLLFARSDASEERMNEIAKEIGGEIVGKISGIHQYQIEVSSMSRESLENVCEKATGFDEIKFAIVDNVVTMENQTIKIPNDPWRDNFQGIMGVDWDEENPSGYNWWLEATKVVSAWQSADSFSRINVGVVDNGFDTNHEDLNITVINNEQNNVEHHGTHVAGIIGATSNNGIGISGILDQVNLYGVDCYPTSNHKKNSITVSLLMDGIQTCLDRNCKVINMSSGISPTNTKDTKENAEATAHDTIFYLLSMLDEREEGDFIIVQSAGNGDKTGKGIDTGTYNGYFSSITEKMIKEFMQKYVEKNGKLKRDISVEEIMDSYMIVGAVDNKQKKGEWQLAKRSNYGDAITVCAPGIKVFSTTVMGGINGNYANASGTSVSAPIVTGITAMVWSINPDMNAKKVKEIIQQTADITVLSRKKEDKGEYKMINASKAVEEALKYTEEQDSTNEDVLVVPITPTDDTEIWNTFLQEKQYKPNITDWTTTELKYCLLDIDQDGRKELILTPGTNWDDFQIYQVYTIGEDGKIYLADDFTTCYDLSYSSKYKALAYNSSRPSEMSASLEYHGMDGTGMVENFAVNMEVDLDIYLPVYKVQNTTQRADTTITEAEYEAYQKECTPLTGWKKVESKSEKKDSDKTQTSDPEWKTAYAQFLRSGEYMSDISEADTPRFFVQDVEGNGSSELVIIPGTSSIAGGHVYTFVNGEVVHAGETCGTYGCFVSYPSDGLILSSYSHMGTDLEEYFTLSDGELISQARWISSHTEGENWYLNDQETTQEAYENWKTENVTGENFVVEYQNAHTITEENIQTYVK